MVDVVFTGVCVRFPTTEAFWRVHDVHWEGNVDRTESQEDDVTNRIHALVVAHGNTERWDNLGPAQASVDHEDENREDVKPCPEVWHFRAWKLPVDDSFTTRGKYAIKELQWLPATRASEWELRWPLENVKLKLVDVAHWNCGGTRAVVEALVAPEQTETQPQDCPEVDEIRRRSDVVWNRVTKAELKQVDRHEGQQDDSADCKVQLT